MSEKGHILLNLRDELREDLLERLELDWSWNPGGCCLLKNSALRSFLLICTHRYGTIVLKKPLRAVCDTSTIAHAP